MNYRVTFTVDSEAMAFLQQVGGKNRSGYINELLKRERRRALERALFRATARKRATRRIRRSWQHGTLGLKTGLRAVDVSRIENKQGVLDRKYLGPIKEAVRIVFDLQD